MVYGSSLTDNEGENLVSAENKAVVRRLFHEVWNRGNLDVADEIFAPDYVNHTPFPGGLSPGVSGFKQFISKLRATFAGFQMTLEDLIAEEDKVVARRKTRSAHKHEWAAIAPTGKGVTLTEIGIFRIAAGKIVESWVITSDQSGGDKP